MIAQHRFGLGLWLCMTLICGCAGRVLQHEQAERVLRLEEYDEKLKIAPADSVSLPPSGAVESPAAGAGAGTESGAAKSAAGARPDAGAGAQGTGKDGGKPLADKAKSKADKKGAQKKKAGKGQAESEKEAVKVKGPREPDIEDAVGFDGRRPLIDPFRVGEKVTLALSYFNVVAGTMDVEVKPYATVNGRKAYHFEVTARSNSFFSRIYAVDDKAVTYVSFDDLTPFNLMISIKESKQLAETRTLFDWKENKASYWKKRITRDHGEESKKLEWDIKPFSQNVISAAYYLRTFKIEPGKKLAFRVADEGKNIVFRGDVLRREILDTEIGPLNTVVIKPELTVDGVFTPVGDIMMWMTDDDRKFIVRMESKIKIGTIVAKLKALEKGG